MLPQRIIRYINWLSLTADSTFVAALAGLIRKKGVVTLFVIWVRAKFFGKILGAIELKWLING